MLLAFPDSTAPGERGQKNLVDMPIERRKLEPLLQIRERFVIGNALDEMLQQRRRDSRGIAAAAR